MDVIKLKKITTGYTLPKGRWRDSPMGIAVACPKCKGAQIFDCDLDAVGAATPMFVCMVDVKCDCACYLVLEE